MTQPEEMDILEVLKLGKSLQKFVRVYGWEKTLLLILTALMVEARKADS